MKRLGIYTIALVAMLFFLASSSNKPDHAAESAASATITKLPVQLHLGGRAVAVTINPANKSQAIVASESGGLYKTDNNGLSWHRLDGLPMFRFNNVAYAPGSPAGQSVVIATGAPDGHIPDTGGVWRSTNGGQDWSRPNFTNSTCHDGISFYGIDFYGSGNVILTTDCSIAYCTDYGVSCTFHNTGIKLRSVAIKPSPDTGAHFCDDRGHYYAPDAPNDWTFSTQTNTKGCNSMHAVGISPLENGVVYLAGYINNPTSCRAGRSVALYEGLNNGDGSWRRVFASECYGGGREPWLATVLSRDGNHNHFDLYFSNGDELWRNTCQLATGSQDRCPSTGWTKLEGGHADRNHMAFDPDNHCPRYVVSDGGIHDPFGINLPPTCGERWAMGGSPISGYNALQVYDLAGVNLPGHIDLYLGSQDNGFWGSADDFATQPFQTGVEGGYIQAPSLETDHANVRITYRDVGFPPTGINIKCQSHYQNCNIGSWTDPTGRFNNHPPFLAQGETYLQWNEPITSTFQLNLTGNGSLNWTPVISNTWSLYGSPQISMAGDRIVAYQAYNRQIWDSACFINLGLFKVTGMRFPGGLTSPTYRLLDTGFGCMGFYPNGQGTWIRPAVFGVDPYNPNNIIIMDQTAQSMRTLRLDPSGNPSWQMMTQLTHLATGNGTYRLGLNPADFEWDFQREGILSQVHVIAYDPIYRNHILVGTETSGIIQSVDGGSTWEVVPGSEQIKAISDFAFQKRISGPLGYTFYASTYGSWVWKIFFPHTLRPYQLSDVSASAWDNGVLQNPYTQAVFSLGDFMDPTPCPTCVFLATQAQRLLGLHRDLDGKVNLLQISGGHLIGSDYAGNPLENKVSTEVIEWQEKYENCPMCYEVLNSGGTIRGLILDNGELVSLIVSYGDLPGWEEIQTFDAFLPEDEEYEGAPMPDSPTGPYLRLIGTRNYSWQPALVPGDTLKVLGTSFMPDTICSPVELLVNSDLLKSGVSVNEQGEFQFSQPFNYPHGDYLVTARQDCPGEPTVERSAMLMVIIEESWWEGSLIFLPLVVKP